MAESKSVKPAEQNQTADVEVSDAGVEVRTTEGGSQSFTPVKVYNKAGDERQATSLAEQYALEFDGFYAKPTNVKSSK